MLWTLLLEIGLALLLAGGGWLLYLWAVRSGQYDDPEGPKYRLFDDQEPLDRPAEKANPKKIETSGGSGKDTRRQRGT